MKSFRITFVLQGEVLNEIFFGSNWMEAEEKVRQMYPDEDIEIVATADVKLNHFDSHTLQLN